MRHILTAALMFVVAMGFALVPHVQRTAAQADSNWIEAFDYNAVVDRYAAASNLTVRIWDAATDQLLHTVQIPDPRSSPDFQQLYFGRLIFSPLGDRLAVSLYGDAGGGFVIIDASTGQIALQSSLHVPSVGPIAWSPDGDFLAGIYYYTPMTPVLDGFLGLWDTHTGQEINNYLIGTSPIALDWQPSDARLAFADAADVVVWDVEQWQELYRVSADENGVISVAWSPSRDTFASIGIEDIIRLWDGNTGELQRAIDAGDSGKDVPGVFWSQSGDWVGVAYGQHIEIWDPETGVSVFSYEAEEQIAGVAVLSDGSIIFASVTTVEKLKPPLLATP